MRVVHVLRTLTIGGAELCAVTVAEWQASNGCSVSVLGAPGPLMERIATEVEVVHPRPGFVGLIRTLRSLTSDSSRQVILHAHQRREALAALIAASGRSHVTVVAHAHTELPTSRGRWLSFRSAHIFAVGPSVRDMVVDTFGRDPARVTVVDNVPTTNAAPCEHVPDAQRVRVVNVARVAPQKDPERFISTIVELQRSDDDTRWEGRWHGHGPLLAEMRALSEGTTCQFVGTTDDVADALRHADVLLLTSRWEGLPLTVLEGLASGVPVVAPDVGSLKALIEEHQCGILIAADAAPPAVAAAVRAAVKPGPARDARVAAGLLLIRTRYSPDVAFPPIVQAYRQLMQV